MLKFWDKYSLSNNQLQSDLWRDKRFIWQQSFTEEAADYIPPITSQIKYIASGIIYWNI